MKTDQTYSFFYAKLNAIKTTRKNNQQFLKEVHRVKMQKNNCCQRAVVEKIVVEKIEVGQTELKTLKTKH